MYKNEYENVEIYFLCDKREDMELIETYYDPVLDVHNWYFNCYLCYIYWQDDYKDLTLGPITKYLLTTAASKYIMYILEEKKYQTKKEYRKFRKDLSSIDKELKSVIKGDNIISAL